MVDSTIVVLHRYIRNIQGHMPNVREVAQKYLSWRRNDSQITLRRFLKFLCSENLRKL